MENLGSALEAIRRNPANVRTKVHEVDFDWLIRLTEVHRETFVMSLFGDRLLNRAVHVFNRQVFHGVCLNHLVAGLRAHQEVGSCDGTKGSQRCKIGRAHV